MLDDETAQNQRATRAAAASTRAHHRGRWKKGISGNPRGRPKSDFLLRDLAQQYSAEGLERLVAIMRDPKTKPETVATVVGMIWDRSFGRAPASLDVNHRHTMAEEFETFIRELHRRDTLPPVSGRDVVMLEAARPSELTAADGGD